MKEGPRSFYPDFKDLCQRIESAKATLVTDKRPFLPVLTVPTEFIGPNSQETLEEKSKVLDVVRGRKVTRRQLVDTISVEDFALAVQMTPSRDPVCLLRYYIQQNCFT